MPEAKLEEHRKTKPYETDRYGVLRRDNGPQTSNAPDVSTKTQSPYDARELMGTQLTEVFAVGDFSQDAIDNANGNHRNPSE